MSFHSTRKQFTSTLGPAKPVERMDRPIQCQTLVR